MRNPYSPDFYKDQMAGSARAAAAVLPVMVSIFRPASVVDVGCGVGTWLSECTRLGVTDILGVDGDHVPTGLLKIREHDFLRHDLGERLSIGRRFDMALCLEVAEHLPMSRAPGFVRDLTRLAPVILFSAAVPGQGGIDHINEQWPEYWRALFDVEGYRCLDIVRPMFWTDERVAPWYRQNLILYISGEITPPNASEFAPPLSVVHPAVFCGRVRPSPRLLLYALLKTTLTRIGTLLCPRHVHD